MYPIHLDHAKIAIIGLGYVGLPLAVEFGKKFDVLGFDINTLRVAQLRIGQDDTLETTSEELALATQLQFSTNAAALADCNVFIVTVPTPIDKANRPDLTPLVKASETVGKVLKQGDIVIYESTVYPGATEEVCVPVLEKFSGLKYISRSHGSPRDMDCRATLAMTAISPSLRGAEGDVAIQEVMDRHATLAMTEKGFYCGYSPERINPGDKVNTLTKIKKITSGSTPEIADVVDALYNSIITAGTHKASSIKVAEAAKVIENTQRDLNIALVNELSVIFERLDIDTLEVLEAAGSKWNFLPFRPGMVGGHCIGVDPYYLTHKAEEVGYHPQVILAGRRINDNMARYVARNTIKLMLKNGLDVPRCRIGVLGITFKENCPDIRNSKVADMVREFEAWGATVVVADPWANADDVAHEYNVQLGQVNAANPVDALVVAVGHNEYRHVTPNELRALCRGSKPVLADVKSLYNRHEAAAQGFTVFRL